MRFFSEDIRILLQCVRAGNVRSRDGTRRMVFEQLVLISLEQKTLHGVSAQKEKLPVGMLQQFDP